MDTGDTALFPILRMGVVYGRDHRGGVRHGDRDAARQGRLPGHRHEHPERLFRCQPVHGCAGGAVYFLHQPFRPAGFGDCGDEQLAGKAGRGRGDGNDELRDARRKRGGRHRVRDPDRLRCGKNIFRQPETGRHTAGADGDGQPVYVLCAKGIHGRVCFLVQAGGGAVFDSFFADAGAGSGAGDVQREYAPWHRADAVQYGGAADRAELRAGYQHAVQHHEHALFHAVSSQYGTKYQQDGQEVKEVLSPERNCVPAAFILK